MTLQEADVDLLLIARKIWRYRLATLPVLALTLCGIVYALAIKEPVYEASSSYILINPPAPPTAEQIALNPDLGNINSDNPYTRFADQSVVVQVLASAMETESARKSLQSMGADERYTVEPTSGLGYSSPIVKISGLGSTPEAAIRTVRLAGSAVTRQLRQIQSAEGVNPKYMIKTYQVHAPDEAQLRASDKLRLLVGVLTLGAILLFVSVSVADGLGSLRMERATARARSGEEEDPWAGIWSELGEPPDEGGEPAAEPNGSRESPASAPHD